MQKKEVTIHPRPESPITPKVWEKIQIHASVIQLSYRDANEVDREIRREDIIGELITAAVKSWKKFRSDKGCTYDSFASHAIDWAAKNYMRNTWNKEKKRRNTLSLNVCVREFDIETSNGSMTFLELLEDTRANAGRLAEAFDLREMLAALEKHDPQLAEILVLRYQGHKMQEIAGMVGVKPRRLWVVLWPRVRKFVREFYKDTPVDFSRSR